MAEDADPFSYIPDPLPVLTERESGVIVPFSAPLDVYERDMEGRSDIRTSGRTRDPLPIQWFEQIEPKLTGLWLVKNLLPSTGIAVLYGHPSCGKTFLALDWAMHVALGWAWMGNKVKQGAVVYVGAEGLGGLQNRVEAFRKHHDIQAAPFALIPTPIDLQAPDADVDLLVDAIRTVEARYDVRVALIVIDTLSKTFGAGKENTDDMVTYVANCTRVAASFECLTLPIHHRPKDAESEEPRGHSSLKGGAETVIICEAGETKKARVTKQKDGQDGLEFLFRLRSVQLGLDEDDEPVTSCVVEATDAALAPRGEAPDAKIRRLSDGAKLALAQFHEVMERDGIYPPKDIPDAELDRMKVGKVILLADWRAKSVAAAGHDPDMKPDTLSKAFRRNLEKLQSSKIIRVWEKWAWTEIRPRTRPDTDPDKINPRSGHAGHSGVPPTGEYPSDVRSMSGQYPPDDDRGFLPWDGDEE